MKCLVVGAEGFVGARLTGELLERGHEVVCLEVRGKLRRLSRYADSIAFHLGDCADTEIIQSIVRQYGIEAIYYGPFYRSADVPSVHGEWRVMGQGALDCFNLTRTSSVQRVIFPSSTAVHGMQPAGPESLCEESRSAPFMTYGATKLVCEYFARDINAQLGCNAVVALRLPAIYGPGAAIASRGVNVFPVQAARALPGTVGYTADTRICMTHVDDASRILADAIEAPVCEHTVYEMGGIDVSFGEIADAVRLRIPDADLRFGSDNRCPLPHRIDYSRARKAFGARHLDLSVGIDSIISYERDGK